MIFTKPMIDLAKEIRRRAPSDLKPSIKMANPELFDELAKICDQSKDAVLKALIKEICMMADKPWTLISDSDANDSKHVASPVKPTNQANLTKETSQTDRPKRIYRGQVVHN